MGENRAVPTPHSSSTCICTSFKASEYQSGDNTLYQWFYTYIVYVLYFYWWGQVIPYSTGGGCGVLGGGGGGGGCRGWGGISVRNS